MLFSMDDLGRQIEEIEALSSIYENEWKTLSEYTRTYELALCRRTPFEMHFQVTLPSNYPSTQDPVYELVAPWLKAAERSNLKENLESIVQENRGESILFLWTEFIREFVEKKLENSLALKSVNESKMQDSPVEPQTTVKVPDIFHGEPIIDRKSTFQGHVAKVTKPSEVKAVINALLQNRKIANATHNIMAYRICNKNTSNYLQDCDDDGETAAGGRLLHLLEIVGAKDVVVVVSRWYGGILLGPDRFKHINNAARNILLQENLIDNTEKKTKVGK